MASQDAQQYNTRAPEDTSVNNSGTESVYVVVELEGIAVPPPGETLTLEASNNDLSLYSLSYQSHTSNWHRLKCDDDILHRGGTLRKSSSCFLFSRFVTLVTLTVGALLFYLFYFMYCNTYVHSLLFMHFYSNECRD